jgi:tetratricopeptide (TPR) repeat protein
MKLRITSSAVGALVLLLAPLALEAAQAGRVIGKVTDATGKPIEGVKVTITSTAITTFKAELVTNKDGKFEKLFVDAVPKYHYKFEKQGFTTFEQDFKVATGDMNAQLEVKLNPAGAAAAAPGAAAQQAPAPAAADPFVKAFNEAVELYQAGDLDGAMTKVAEATKAGPDKANGYDLGAKIAYKKKDWDKAIEYGEMAAKLDEENSSAAAILVDAYKAKGNTAKAKEWNQKYAAANADDPNVMLNQAIELYNKGDFKTAAPMLKKVIEVQPENAKAHFLLGMADASLGKTAEMKTHLNEYLKLEPTGKDAPSAKEMLDAFK